MQIIDVLLPASSGASQSAGEWAVFLPCCSRLYADAALPCLAAPSATSGTHASTPLTSLRSPIPASGDSPVAGGLPPGLAALLGASSAAAPQAPAQAPKSAEQLLSSLQSLIGDTGGSVAWNPAFMLIKSSGYVVLTNFRTSSRHYRPSTLRSPAPHDSAQANNTAHPSVTSMRNEFRSPPVGAASTPPHAAERGRGVSFGHAPADPAGGGGGAAMYGNGVQSPRHMQRPPQQQQQQHQPYAQAPAQAPHNAHEQHAAPRHRIDARRSASPPGPADARRGSSNSYAAARGMDLRGSRDASQASASAAGPSAPQVGAAPNAAAAAGAGAGKSDPSVGDLSQFDPTTFDPTDAACLDRLAKMYQNTYNVREDRPLDPAEQPHFTHGTQC